MQFINRVCRTVDAILAKAATGAAAPRALPAMESMEDRVLFATFLVTNTNDSGAGSLRDAMKRANSNAGADVIQFKIGTGGRRSIAPLSALPQLMQPTTIDATTQGGYAGKPLIEIRGDRMGGTTAGLVLQGGASTVKGLVINRFNGNGILLINKGGNAVRNCWIGVDATGSYAAANAQKGIIVQSAGNTIGGTSAAYRNVISGNAGVGVQLYTSAATGNRVLGNYIGTDATGTKAVGNGTSGVAVRSAPRNVIGGTAAGSRNVISGNKQDGIVINGSGARYNVIQGNYVGTNAAGTGRLGNGWYGIETSESYTTIGGTSAAARNVISANNYSGVVLWLASGSYNKVQGNFIGTDKSGKLDLGNRWRGVDISSGSSNNLIGGATSAERNVISGNDMHGVLIYQGTTNKIQGNFIGTCCVGTTPRANVGDGIHLVATKYATIQSNRIGYNGGYGVHNGQSSGTKLYSNTLIGDALWGVTQS